MKQFFIIGGFMMLLVGAASFAVYHFSSVSAFAPTITDSDFYYEFDADGVLNEAGSRTESSSPYWWLSSGGQFFLENGIGRTIQGELSGLAAWRINYTSANSQDTDNGYHPQNLLRLLTQSMWQNFDQQVYFRITKINVSRSPERDRWSGIFLFNRYENADNLYYAGIRVDGYAVIKKKKDGVYYTLAYEPVYWAESGYDRDTNPNVIPGKQWIGLRSVVTNDATGNAHITLYVDKENNGIWTLAAQAVDNGLYGGSVMTQKGYAGIRGDFMDLEFDNYQVIVL